MNLMNESDFNSIILVVILLLIMAKSFNYDIIIWKFAINELHCNYVDEHPFIIRYLVNFHIIQKTCWLTQNIKTCNNNERKKVLVIYKSENYSPSFHMFLVSLHSSYSFFSPASSLFLQFYPKTYHHHCRNNHSLPNLLLSFFLILKWENLPFGICKDYIFTHRAPLVLTVRVCPKFCKLLERIV